MRTKAKLQRVREYNTVATNPILFRKGRVVKKGYVISFYEDGQAVTEVFRWWLFAAMRVHELNDTLTIEEKAW